MLPVKLIKKNIGGKIILTCKSRESIEWYFERSSPHPNSIPVHWGNKYKKLMLQPHSAGLYFCYSAAHGSFHGKLSYVELKIYGKITPYYISICMNFI